MGFIRKEEYNEKENRIICKNKVKIVVILRWEEENEIIGKFCV